MKKVFSLVACVLMVTCFMFCSCDSGTFVNPGDNLGGGGTGTTPTEIESEVEENVNENVAVDLGKLGENIDLTGVVTLASDNLIDKNDLTDGKGSFVLSGNYSNGIFSTGDDAVAKDSEIHLFLNNATISGTDISAICKTDKTITLIITALDGTTNTITNTGNDLNAIHVKGYLIINGTGTINITSESKSAIKVSKTLSIVGVTLNINAENHGVSAQSILAQGCTININSAEKDGLNAECDDDITEFPEDYSSGYVALKDVTYTCSVKGDGIQADTLVKIDGGTLNITTNGEFVAYSSANMTTYDLTRDDFRYISSGSTYKKVADDYTGSSTKYALAQSCKGIKVGEIEYEDENDNEVTVTTGDYAILIMGDPTISINSSDDAIHTNSGSTYIKNGTITINTLDDGITSDLLSEIDGGTINIQSCYEGIEGGYVTITGGTLNIISSDDGINAASDNTSITEYIIISGGNVTINAVGDGVDSNGSLLISGGSLVVYGPTSGNDAGLDAETGIIINGGYVFATSTLGMVETPSTNSSQYVVSYAQSSSLSSGTVFTICDNSGNEIFSVQLAKTCQSIIFSCPEFAKGSTYKLYGNSTLLSTITISSTITTVGSSNAPGGNQPGDFGGGGRRFGF